MSDITVEQLSITLRLTPEKLLRHLKDANILDKTNQSSLSKDEKNILTKHLRSKRSGSQKTLTGKIILPIKPIVKKSSGVTVQVKRAKNANIVEKTTVSDKSQEDALRHHHDSIKRSKLKAQALLEQDKKRQKLMREQSEKIKQENKDSSQEKEQKESVEKPISTVEKTLITPSVFTSDKNKKKGSKHVVVVQKTQDKTNKDTKSYAGKGRYIFNTNNSRKLKKKERTLLSQKLREEQGQQHGFVKPVNPVIYEVKIPQTIQVSSLAQQMNVKAAEVLKQMMGMGVMATINDAIDQDTAMLVVEEMGHNAIVQENNTIEDVVLSELESTVKGEQSIRPPVVAIMGHVDHGKTSLLDYIRQAKVAKNESGGITQHIGAYQVKTNQGNITFLDTPGHSAFTQMRSRGAGATDIIILVVAADDGVMPETIDSIKHAKESKATIIVAINKMDKEGADAKKVKEMLSSHDVIAEEWGGDVMMVEVSAHTGQGVDALLEAITLQAEVLELSVVVKARARGVVLEARLDKGRGKIATLLVQEGSLNKGDVIVAGQEYGKIKQIINDTAQMIQVAQPSMPVEVLGLSGVPEAGDEFVVLNDEKKAKEVAGFRREKDKEMRLQKQQVVKMEDFMDHMQQANKQKLNILLKADVRGSTQALANALEDLSTDDLIVNIVSSGVGGINDSDINLASTSNATVLGFNVRADAVARKTAEQNNVDVRYYSIIYHLIDDIKAMMSGLLAPELSENILGLAQVKEIFKSKALGDIAGCIVLEGKMKINNPIRVLRDNVVIYEGELESLRRFKDEVKEVASGVECGIGVKDYNDVQAGDQIEVFEQIKTPVKL